MTYYDFIKVEKPKDFSYPQKPEILGEHLHKKHMDLGMLQREVANIIGISEASVYNWENDRTYPVDIFVQKIIEFLGYEPD